MAPLLKLIARYKHTIQVKDLTVNSNNDCEMKTPKNNAAAISVQNPPYTPNASLEVIISFIYKSYNNVRLLSMYACQFECWWATIK